MSAAGNQWSSTADDNLLGRVTTQARAGTPEDRDHGQLHHQQPDECSDQRASLKALTLSGSGVLAAGNIQAQRLSIGLSGSGAVRTSGTVTRLDVSLGGSGDAQLGQLAARDVNTVLSGSGRIVTRATDTLQASVPGSGTIVYTGNPAHVMTSVTGSGTITRR